jgi:DNA helicase HerA-like ATPase
MELSNDAVGAMYPFVSNALKDTQGVQLGYETYSGDPFWFDLKMKEGKLRNSNVCLVCAKTGGGKTYTVNKICNWFKNTSFNKNMRQYIVDPLGDYYGLFVNHYNVSKIDMTDASKGLINPLQILDEEKDRTTHANEFIV